MSLYSRRYMLTAFGALAGCGFTPIYGPSGIGSSLKGTIQIDAPSNKDGFDFVRQLELRLGIPTQPRYALSYTLRVKREGVGVTPAQEIIRFNLVGRASFVLQTSDGKTLIRDNVQNFTSYSVDPVNTSISPPSTNSTISTLAARQDARSRLMIILANQIVTRLEISAKDWVE